MDGSSSTHPGDIAASKADEHLPVRPPTPVYLQEGQAIWLLETLNPFKLPVVHKMIDLGTSHWVSFHDCDIPQRILQIPIRDGQAYDARNQAALQEYLAQSKLLDVQRVLAYDSTENNLLQRQYIIQTGIRGSPLASHLHSFSKKDRMYFIPTLVKAMHQIENVVFEKSGRLVAASCIPPKKGLEDERTTDLRTPGTILQHEADSHPLIKLAPFSIHSGANDCETTSYTTLKHLMYTQFKAWYKSEPSLNPQILYGIAKKMAAFGLFDRQEPHVLWHREFGPNSIFVDKSNGKWEITGIVGWHNVLSVPRVLTRQPPEWLWTFGPEINGDFSTQGLSKETQEVKEAFDKYMERTSPGWREDAYGSGHWLRRLARFAIDRFQFRGDYLDFQTLREDWAGENSRLDADLLDVGQVLRGCESFPDMDGLSRACYTCGKPGYVPSECWSFGKWWIP
ncbi:MAG: hypothetical protein Q9202_003012 [Teloschistes flavicans]